MARLALAGFRPHGPTLLVAALTVATVASVRAQAPVRSDSTGTIVGIVVMREGDLPLAYSVVSASTLGLERFSDRQGVFTLTELPAGPVQLRVRHLGYSPADLSVTVHGGRVDTVRVPLAHIAVRLTTVQVRGYPPCKNPGVPKATDDSAFATVFGQLHQNAEQYRLLTNTYPFVSSVERTLSNVLVNGDVKVESVDTTTFASASPWKYRPGTVISRSGGPPRMPGGGATLMMNIPTLVHFADSSFLNNHCFYNGGLETVDGVDLLRVDFVAAARISDPDVDGSMYLDPASFQIRRSVLRLSKIPRGLTGLNETEAVTYFGEVLPSVPIISGIFSVMHIETNSKQPSSVALGNEEQRLIRVHFLNGMPGEELKKP